MENIKQITNLDLRTNPKIAIIGAGSAGIHMAYLLKEKGFKNITIFERENRLGGKSYSIKVNNVVHEMGTCYFTSTYKKIIDLLHLNNLSYTRVPIEQRTCVLEDNTTEIVASKWVIDQIKNIYGPKYFKILPKKLIGYSFLKALQRYCRLYPDYVSRSLYNIPQNAKQDLTNHLSLSMRVFLEKNRLRLLEPFFYMCNTNNYYGYTENIPAYYGLYWFHEILVNDYCDLLSKKSDPIIIGMLNEGYQELWRRLRETSNSNVNYNANVIKIERNINQHTPIRITYEQDHDVRTENFDFLISAVPLQEIIPLLDHTSPFEKELIKHQICSKVICRLVNVHNPHKDDAIVYRLHYLHPDNIHRVVAYRNADSILNHHKSHDQTIVVYQYYENENDYDEELARKYFISNLTEQRIKIKDVLETKVWRYFPRFDSVGIQKKLPWKLIEEQGKNHTWYVGSSVCFESVNAVVNFNCYMVDQLIK